MSPVVTFGEIMLRLSPPRQLRFVQARSFDAVYGGSEANVAVSLAHFGVETDYITRLPAHEIGDACLNYLRQFGVGTAHIRRGGSRLGIYYLENGAVNRSSNVIYDRAGSSLAEIQPGMVDWETAFAPASWFHWTGITPAVSENAAAVCLEAVKTAKRCGLTVSTDLNFRSKLWNYGREPGEVMQELVPYCDVALGNEEHIHKFFGIQAEVPRVTSEKPHIAKYRIICEQLVARFPNLETIAITQRGSISASHNTLSAILWHKGQVDSGPTYDVTHIVDRVGGGDSFMAGLIYGLLTYKRKADALRFALAASALKHTIFGDFNLVSVDEVEKLMRGDASGRVSR